MQISRGKFDRLPRTPAESTALALMDTGLRRFGPARPTRDASYSVSVRQVATLLPRFFQTAPRGHRPCASLALRLHQTLGRGLSPPSCQTCSAHPQPWTEEHRPPLLGNRAVPTSPTPMPYVIARRFPAVYPARRGRESLRTFGTEVGAFGHGPLIVLFRANGADQPDHRLRGRKNADDVRSSLDLLIQALKRVRAVQLPLMLEG
jgi:hypothetical protein